MSRTVPGARARCNNIRMHARSARCAALAIRRQSGHAPGAGEQETLPCLLAGSAPTHRIEKSQRGKRCVAARHGAHGTACSSPGAKAGAKPMARGASARRTTERISLVAEVAAIPPRWWLYEPQKQGKSRFSEESKAGHGTLFFLFGSDITQWPSAPTSATHTSGCSTRGASGLSVSLENTSARSCRFARSS